MAGEPVETRPTAGTPLDTMLDRLRGARPSGAGFAAYCPAHEDRERSLSVTEGDGKVVLLKCHAGCAATDVVAALGLSMADLFPERRSNVEWLRQHRYVGADGTALYRIRRGEGRSGKRIWRTEAATATGWENGYSGPKVLYNLPGLLDAAKETIWVTEGERDADSLVLEGLLATTVSNSSWAGVDTTALADREIVVVVDADEAGWKRGIASCEAALSAGATVRAVLRPPDGYKDLTEFLSDGLGPDELVQVDLIADPAPVAPEAAAPGRSAFRKEGTSYFISAPSSVMIGLLQRGDIHPEDFATYTLMEERAGQSGLAKVSGAEVGRLLRIRGRAARDSMKRLAACGLVMEIRRGAWRVYNPSRDGRMGPVDLTLVFSAHGQPPTPSSSSKSPTNKSPEKNPEVAAPARLNGFENTVQEDANGRLEDSHDHPWTRAEERPWPAGVG